MSGGADGTGVRVDVWPSSRGDLHFAWLDGVPTPVAVEAVLAQMPSGAAAVIDVVAVRDGLLQRGARQVRHLFAMRRDLEDLPDVPAVPGLGLREWRDDDAELLAPALVSAYDAGHVDAMAPDLDVAARTLALTADDPANPRLRATTVAEVDGRPVGAALVLSSTHVDGWRGPWVMNVFRAPDPGVPGVGRAMLLHAMHVLREDGESVLGLAVTATNPARQVYERLGFTDGFEGWVLVLP